MPDTTARSVQFELSLNDYRAMLRHLCAPKSRLSNLLAVMLGTFLLVTLGTAFFARSGMAFPAGLVAGFLLMLGNTLRAQRRLQPRPHGALLCRYAVQLNDERVHVQTPHWTCELPWTGILAVEEATQHCFLRIDTLSAYAIPKRAFSDTESARQFVTFARDCMAKAQARA